MCLHGTVALWCRWCSFCVLTSAELLTLTLGKCDPLRSSRTSSTFTQGEHGRWSGVMSCLVVRQLGSAKLRLMPDALTRCQLLCKDLLEAILQASDKDGFF